MGAPPNFVAAMHRSRTARSALRGLLATKSRFYQLEPQVIFICGRLLKKLHSLFGGFRWETLHKILEIPKSVFNMSYVPKSMQITFNFFGRTHE